MQSNAEVGEEGAGVRKRGRGGRTKEGKGWVYERGEGAGVNRCTKCSPGPAAFKLESAVDLW